MRVSGAVNLHIVRLQRLAISHGGELRLVSRREFDRLATHAYITGPPAVGGLASDYRRRRVYVGPRVCRTHLVANVVHEMWHVFGSPVPPSRSNDTAMLFGAAWELALMRQIGCSLEHWRRRWREVGEPGLYYGGWPPLPLGRLIDASRATFLRWAESTIEHGKTHGYHVNVNDPFHHTTRPCRIGCIQPDGGPLFLNRGLRKALYVV